MRRLPWFAPSLMTAAFALVFPVAGWSAAQAQQRDRAIGQRQRIVRPSKRSGPAPQRDSLAAAARKAKERRKQPPAPPKFSPTIISQRRRAFHPLAPPQGTSRRFQRRRHRSGNSGVAKDEKAWRDKFASLRHKLDQDQTALDVMQRELGESSTQFYGGDPNAAFQDQRSQQPLGSGTPKKSTKSTPRKSRSTPTSKPSTMPRTSSANPAAIRDGRASLTRKWNQSSSSKINPNFARCSARRSSAPAIRWKKRPTAPPPSRKFIRAAISWCSRI